MNFRLSYFLCRLAENTIVKKIITKKVITKGGIMNKQKCMHYEPVHLTRSMSPRTEREFNNIPLITREEMAEELARKATKIINIDTLYFNHMLDLKLKKWSNKYSQ